MSFSLGHVFEAVDTTLNCRVAVKIQSHSEAKAGLLSAQKGLLVEHHTIKKLTKTTEHIPGLPSWSKFACDGQHELLVMPLFGSSLETLRGEGALTTELIASVAVQMVSD